MAIASIVVPLPAIRGFPRCLYRVSTIFSEFARVPYDGLCKRLIERTTVVNQDAATPDNVRMGMSDFEVVDQRITTDEGG